MTVFLSQYLLLQFSFLYPLQFLSLSSSFVSYQCIFLSISPSSSHMSLGYFSSSKNVHSFFFFPLSSLLHVLSLRPSFLVFSPPLSLSHPSSSFPPPPSRLISSLISQSPPSLPLPLHYQFPSLPPPIISCPPSQLLLHYQPLLPRLSPFSLLYQFAYQSITPPPSHLPLHYHSPPPSHPLHYQFPTISSSPPSQLSHH